MTLRGVICPSRIADEDDALAGNPIGIDVAAREKGNRPHGPSVGKGPVRECRGARGQEGVCRAMTAHRRRGFRVADQIRPRSAAGMAKEERDPAVIPGHMRRIGIEVDVSDEAPTKHMMGRIMDGVAPIHRRTPDSRPSAPTTSRV